MVKLINMKKEIKNEPISSLTHFLGALLSIAALVLLIIDAVRFGSAWHIVSFSIFGASLILLYSASAIYHFAPKSTKAKKILHSIDLSMIFVLIAGSYTPIVLVPLRGGWGWSLFRRRGRRRNIRFFDLRRRWWRCWGFIHRSKCLFKGHNRFWRWIKIF